MIICFFIIAISAFPDISKDSKTNYTVKCHNDCHTCYGPHYNQCKSCVLKSKKPWFYETDNTCKPSCPSGSYISNRENKICSECHKECESCFDSNPNSCKSCKSNSINPWFYVEENSCMEKCPLGSFAHSVKEIIKFCIRCHEDCKTCVGANENDCLSCRLDSIKPWYYNAENSCQVECGPGYYVSNENTKICSKCHEDCETCFDFGQSSCSSCMLDSTKSWLFETECVPECPSGTYIFSEHLKICRRCHQECEECFAKENQCTKCKLNSKKQWFHETENSCESECKQGFYISNENNKICKKCHIECQICTGPLQDNCQSCFLNSTKPWYHRSEKACKDKCSKGFFVWSEDAKICSRCHEDCTSCFGFGANMCLSCYRSDKWLFEGSCLDQCPSGSYISDPVTKSCSRCSSECKECAEKHNQCLECNLDSNKPWFYESEKTCRDKCSGFFISNLNRRICSKCHSDCQTCTGPQHDSCKSCYLNSTKPWHHRSENTCKDKCSSGFFIWNKFAKICFKCHDDCIDCAGFGPNMCLSCYRSDKWLFKGSCLDQCPSGSYISDPITKSCTRCHSDCKECVGPKHNQCLKCNLDSYNPWFYDSEKTCRDECSPLGFYISNEKSKICSKCHIKCQTCTGPQELDCKSCILNSTWPWYSSESLWFCWENCPSGFFISNEELKICSKCYQDCKECVGFGPNMCSSCHPPKKWLFEGSCWDKCPSGSYISNPITNSCSRCHSDCKECVGPKYNQCLTCKLDSYNPWFYDSEKTCRDKCSHSGFFISNLNSRICSKCHSDCQTCTGPQHDSCKSCYLNSTKQWYHRSENNCKDKCSKGFFISNKDLRICSKCHEDCEDCFGFGPHNCSLCNHRSNKAWFYQGKCKKQCPSGSYVSNENEKLCSSCYQSCAKCVGPNHDQCLGCILVSHNPWFYESEKACKSNCSQEGFFILNAKNKICSKCHEDCAECFGRENNNCKTCVLTSNKSWYHESEYSCKSVCSKGFFIWNENAKICSKCHEDCEECTAFDQHSCTKCNLHSNKNFLYRHSCVSECPLGTFTNGNDNKCELCHETCEKCSGPSKHHCTSCKLSSKNPWFVQSENSCNSGGCEPGYFISSETSKICGKCHDECNTCTGPTSNNCTSCTNGSNGAENKDWFYKGSCFQKCPPGSYASNPNSRLCSACNIDCGECFGPNHYECINCKLNSNKPWFHETKNSCKNECDANFFISDVHSKICAKCHDNCKTCYGPEPDCDQLCLPMFVSGCHRGCKTCNGPCYNNCESCHIDSNRPWYHQRENTCKGRCSTGFYILNEYLRICSRCHEDCETCSEFGQEKCNSCILTSLKSWFYEGSCSEQCPLGTYVSDSKAKLCSSFDKIFV